MSDHEAEIVRRTLRRPECQRYQPANEYFQAIVDGLKADGVKFPDPPKPVIEVSEAAVRAHRDAHPGRHASVSGLRAAFKVMLRDAITKAYGGVMGNESLSRNNYRDLTGEAWPDD